MGHTYVQIIGSTPMSAILLSFIASEDNCLKIKRIRRQLTTLLNDDRPQHVVPNNGNNSVRAHVLCHLIHVIEEEGVPFFESTDGTQT